MAAQKPIGEILVEMGLITKEQLKDALKYQRTEGKGKKIGEILIAKGYINEKDFLTALGKQFDLPVVSFDQMHPTKEAMQLIGQSVCIEYKIIPLEANETSIKIAISDPLDVYSLDNVRFMVNRDVEVVLALHSDIEKAIDTYYKAEEIPQPLEEELPEATVEEEGDDAPVIRLVNLIITEAVRANASDIHIDPMKDRVRIRYRIDGVCIETESPPKRLQNALLSRVKLMAKMDIAEKRRPQDGKIEFTVDNRALDLRVASLPTNNGESIVLRILDKEKGLVSLEDLGFYYSEYQKLKQLLKRPNGIVLVSGPTGSGKTTTLYAALKEMNKPTVKIITAENPIEYVIDGINQSQVEPKIGLTFARIIRAMLRQAPNIILVGEIRDVETAETAIQASLTGHLVFSTIHTNDAPSALTRLIDMGIKPFLVASSINGILAQRLVRILCNNCKQPYTPEPFELKMIGIKPEDIEGKTIYKPVGCSICKGTGYKGRKGIFELLVMDEELREMAFRRATAQELREAAKSKGMCTLLEDGVRKILDGLTSIPEVLNVAKREDVTY